MQILLAENHVCLYLQQGRLQPQQSRRGHQISNEPLVFDFLLLSGLRPADSFELFEGINSYPISRNGLARSVSPGQSEELTFDYRPVTLDACKPLGPFVTSNSTACPSSRDL
jgi:hypothetical protein